MWTGGGGAWGSCRGNCIALRLLGTKVCRNTFNIDQTILSEASFLHYKTLVELHTHSVNISKQQLREKMHTDCDVQHQDTHKPMSRRSELPYQAVPCE